MAVVLRAGTQKRIFAQAEGAAPTKGTSFRSTSNGAASDTTVVSIKAAVAAKRHWITKAEFANKTAGEYPVWELLEDESGTPVILATGVCNAGVATSLGMQVMDWEANPIEVTSGKTIGFRLQSAVGDVYAAISGYVED